MLLQILAYDNANSECQKAIQPLKAHGAAFEGIFKGFKSMFNIPEYFKIVGNYKNDFSIPEWLLVGLAIFILIC